MFKGLESETMQPYSPYSIFSHPNNSIWYPNNIPTKRIQLFRDHQHRPPSHHRNWPRGRSGRRNHRRFPVRWGEGSPGSPTSRWTSPTFCDAAAVPSSFLRTSAGVKVEQNTNMVSEETINLKEKQTSQLLLELACSMLLKYSFLKDHWKSKV